MSLLDLDARWRRFHDRDRRCPCCGQQFFGVFDIGFDHPEGWPHAARADSGQEVIEAGQDQLGADLCRIGDQRFIHAILTLPIRGSEELFHYGVWTGVHPDDFRRYVLAWQSDDWSGFSQCPGWLMNVLPGFESNEPHTCELRQDDPATRPRLLVQDGPLAVAQEKGISFDELLDIYAASGLDIRPHLMDD